MLRDNFRWAVQGKVAGFRGPDPKEGDLEWLKGRGIKAIIRMAETRKALVSHKQVENAGLRDLPEPVPDFTAPTLPQVRRMVDFIVDSLKDNLPVVVTCGAGRGRTGTILASYLVYEGETAENAIRSVGTIEEDSQRDVVKKFEESIRKRGSRVNRT